MASLLSMNSALALLGKESIPDVHQEVAEALDIVTLVLQSLLRTQFQFQTTKNVFDYQTVYSRAKEDSFVVLRLDNAPIGPGTASWGFGDTLTQALKATTTAFPASGTHEDGERGLILIDYDALNEVLSSGFILVTATTGWVTGADSVYPSMQVFDPATTGTAMPSWLTDLAKVTLPVVFDMLHKIREFEPKKELAQKVTVFVPWLLEAAAPYIRKFPEAVHPVYPL